MGLYRSVESLVVKPYFALEKYVASRQIPALSSASSPLKRLGPKVAGRASFDHSAWDELLKKYVKDGAVDYAGLGRDRSRFDAYARSLAGVDLEALEEREQLALHLNAYNAFCVGHVLDALDLEAGLESILDLSTTSTPIWDKVAGTIGGVDVSLNDIEHDRLRLLWDEPELHACIVCASTRPPGSAFLRVFNGSCPDLAPFAFAADTLEADMADRAAAWLNDTTKGCALESDGAVARLSRILLWFEDDFQARDGPANFAASYARDDATKAALRRGPALRYFTYDWSLNQA